MLVLHDDCASVLEPEIGKLTRLIACIHSSFSSDISKINSTIMLEMKLEKLRCVTRPVSIVFRNLYRIGQIEVGSQLTRNIRLSYKSKLSHLIPQQVCKL
jgi:hypothetical protein